MVAAAAAPARLVVTVAGWASLDGCDPVAVARKADPRGAGRPHTRHMTAAPQPYRPHHAQPYPPQPQPLAAWQAEQALNTYIAQAARRGWVVTARTATTATLNGPVAHIPLWVTVALLLPTFGFSYAFARMFGRRLRWRHVWVDQWGRVTTQNVARSV